MAPTWGSPIYRAVPPDQNTNFNATWMLRGALPWLLIPANRGLPNDMTWYPNMVRRVEHLARELQVVPLAAVDQLTGEESVLRMARKTPLFFARKPAYPEAGG
jgi:hypothetical protein